MHALTGLILSKPPNFHEAAENSETNDWTTPILCIVTLSLLGFSSSIVIDRLRIRYYCYCTEKEIRSIERKDCAVVFKSSTSSPFDSLRKLLPPLQSSGCTIVYKEPSSTQEMTALLNKLLNQQNRIRIVWINAHGNSKIMKIGNELMDPQKLINVAKCISENGQLFLHSCHTGDNRYGDSLALKTSSYRGDLEIFAPEGKCSDKVEVGISGMFAINASYFEPWSSKDLTQRYKGGTFVLRTDLI